MSAMDVLRDDISPYSFIVVFLVGGNLTANRVGIDCLAEVVVTRLNAELLESTISIPAVNYLAFVQVNLLAQTTGPNIGHQFLKLGTFHQGEDVGQGMEFEHAHHG